MNHLPGTEGLDKLKRRPEMDGSGFHGDTFSDGFGELYMVKRPLGLEDSGRFLGRYILHKRVPIHKRIPIHKRLPAFVLHKRMNLMPGQLDSDGSDHDFGKRFSSDAQGFYGDTFSDGFGEFSTAKRTIGGDAFHSDTFSDGFGDFMTV